MLQNSAQDEIWQNIDQLLLVHAVAKYGDNWLEVSKGLKTFLTISKASLSIAANLEKRGRDSEWFTPTRCYQQYSRLLSSQQNTDGISPAERLKQLELKIKESRLQELKKSIDGCEKTLRALKNDIIDIRSGAKDSDLINDPEYADVIAAMEAEMTVKEPITPLKRIKTEAIEKKVTPPSGGKGRKRNETPLLVPITKEQPTPKAMTHEELVQRLLDIHTAIWNHQFASVFQYPVSLEDAPDYDTVIKNRMDLTTLKQKLMDGQIQSAEDFYGDLMLMFRNALTYNMKGSEIFNMTKKFRKFSQKLMEPLLLEAKAEKSAAKLRHANKRISQIEEEDLEELDASLEDTPLGTKWKRSVRGKTDDESDYVFY